MTYCRPKQPAYVCTKISTIICLIKLNRFKSRVLRFSEFSKKYESQWLNFHAAEKKIDQSKSIESFLTNDSIRDGFNFAQNEKSRT